MQRYLLGGYTNRQNNGIYQIDYNIENGELLNYSLVKKMAYPTYISLSPDNKHLFSIDRNEKKGGLSVLERQNDKSWKLVDSLITSDTAGCHINYISENKTVYVTQYHLSTIDVYNFLDNKLTYIQEIKREGSSVRKEQTRARPHCSVTSWHDNILYICDLGTDQVATYKIKKDGTLKLLYELILPSGSGPRHMILNPEESVGYVINELSNTTAVLEISEDGIVSKIIEIHQNIPDNQLNIAHGAAIKHSPDMNYLYVSTRFYDVITVYRVKEEGKLEYIEEINSEGKTPRDFAIDPSGNYILVPHKDSDNISVFRRNTENGKLQFMREKPAVLEVSCILFLE